VTGVVATQGGAVPRAVPRLMGISDRRGCALPLPEWAAQVACSGVTWIQLREKDLQAGELAALAEAVAARLPAGVALSVNGLRWSPGLSCAPWGVHWPEAALAGAVCGDAVRPPSLLGGCLWGFSVHSLSALEAAQRAGADYVIFSPVFAPSCKPGVVGAGLGALRQAVAASSIPVLALGGVTPARAVACLAAGAHGVAVMSGLSDPARAADFLTPSGSLIAR
jgi:thiamine-phosphate pyrophosphorylase